CDPSGASGRGVLPELLDGEIPAGVDTDVGGDVESALRDAARIELGRLEHRARGGERELPAGADGSGVDIRLDDIAVAGDHEELARVADEQQRLEPPQIAVGAPVLRKLDGGTSEVAVFLELALEALEEREGIRRPAGKAGDHLVVVELAHLARVALHHGVAERDLAVAGQRHGAVAPHAQDGRAVWIESLRIGHQILVKSSANWRYLAGVLARRAR